MAMGHKCYISFKTEDIAYKRYIQEEMNVDMIDKSLNEPVESDDEDYILRKTREDYLSTSTVTIHLIGSRSAESLGWHEQRFIKRELQASLYHREGNTRNGILGVVLPSVKDLVFKGDTICNVCGNNHSVVNVKDTTVTEFSYNYFIPNDKCFWTEDDRYCVLITWEAFVNSPEASIDQAFEKRNHPIAEKVKVKP